MLAFLALRRPAAPRDVELPQSCVLNFGKTQGFRWAQLWERKQCARDGCLLLGDVTTRGCCVGNNALENSKTKNSKTTHSCFNSGNDLPSTWLFCSTRVWRTHQGVWKVFWLSDCWRLEIAHALQIPKLIPDQQKTQTRKRKSRLLATSATKSFSQDQTSSACTPTQLAWTLQLPKELPCKTSLRCAPCVSVWWQFLHAIREYK